jgi:hypothetical protein
MSFEPNINGVEIIVGADMLQILDRFGEIYYWDAGEVEEDPDVAFTMCQAVLYAAQNGAAKTRQLSGRHCVRCVPGSKRPTCMCGNEE